MMMILKSKMSRRKVDSQLAHWLSERRYSRIGALSSRERLDLISVILSILKAGKVRLLIVFFVGMEVDKQEQKDGKIVTYLIFVTDPTDISV